MSSWNSYHIIIKSEYFVLITAPSQGGSDNEVPLITEGEICCHSWEQVAVKTSF